MPQKKEHRRQISVGFSEPQHEWLARQASRRAIGVAEYLRRLVDGIMLGDNTMSRGVDWQPQTLAVPPLTGVPRGNSPIGVVVTDSGRFRAGDVVMTTSMAAADEYAKHPKLTEEQRQEIERRLSGRR